MQIILTNEESEKYFHNALCNAIGTGYMNGYGLELEWDEDKYKEAKSKLTSPCIEDVWMQLLKDGYSLTFKDIEGNGDNDSSITLKDVHDKVQLTPIEHLLDMIIENDDVITADVILQTVFWGEIIFG